MTNNSEAESKNEHLSVWARLPKIEWKIREDGTYDYWITDRYGNGEWGYRSSNVGNVIWENKSSREAFFAYAAIMEVPEVFHLTHTDLPITDSSKAEALKGFQPIQQSVRMIIGSEEISDSVRGKFVEDIKNWSNSHPELFEDYFKELALMSDPNSFIVEKTY